MSRRWPWFRLAVVLADDNLAGRHASGEHSTALRRLREVVRSVAQRGQGVRDRL
jgi:hypothetical protein